MAENEILVTYPNYSKLSIDRDINGNIDRIIKKEAKGMFEKIQKLERHLGKTMIVKYEDLQMEKIFYLVGKIASPPLSKEGRLNSDNYVFKINYDLKQGNYPSIKKENILSRYDGFFPLFIWDLVHPRKFEINGKSALIEELRISDKDSILHYLEKL